MGGDANNTPVSYCLAINLNRKINKMSFKAVLVLFYERERKRREQIKNGEIKKKRLENNEINLTRKHRIKIQQ